MVGNVIGYFLYSILWIILAIILFAFTVGIIGKIVR
jgi:hypothetical protein